MREYDFGRDFVTTPDTPEGLLRLISKPSAKYSFIAYKLSGGVRRVPFVGPLFTAVLTFLYFENAASGYGVSVGEIMKGLNLSEERVARALLFLYGQGFATEVQYPDDAFTYMLTASGCVFAGSIMDLEDKNDCRSRCGIAFDDNGEPFPILLCPQPLVLFE